MIQRLQENNRTEGTKSPELLEYFDQVICIDGEMIQGQGEDSFFYAVNQEMASGGVFDGCGGSGARKYEMFGGHTGAYIGARIISGMTYDYLNWKASENLPDFWGKQIKEFYGKGIERYKKAGGTGRGFRGSMVKDFPSTAVFSVTRYEKGKWRTSFFWAGDSRGYILTAKGLSLVTKDDVEGEDALSNLVNDGVLTNVISGSGEFEIHECHIEYENPCIVITATDGCFNYLPSPMYFEYLLLDTLQNAENMEQWELDLHCKIHDMSGDDHTLIGLIFGYGSFQKLKEAYRQRLTELKRKYIEPWEQMEAEEQIRLWEEYCKEVNIGCGGGI